MKTFRDDLIVKSIDVTKWQLVNDFYFYFNENNKQEGVVVTEGFVTDFASVPRLMWAALPPTGLYTKAAVMHDFLYQNGFKMGFDRKFCDDMFLEAMKALGVGLIARTSMYWGVRVFGGKYFIQ